MLANLLDEQNFTIVDGIYLNNDKGLLAQGLNENKQKAIYDSRSESYKEQVKNNYPTSLGYNHLLLTYREHLRWVKSLQLKSGERVLDIGCNIGQMLHLMKHQAEIKAVGVDISIESLQNAKLNALNSFDFVLCSVEKGIPFDDNSFDVITCMDVIEHLENPEFVLSEMKRVLKPGGRFLFHIPVTDIVLSLDWFYEKMFPESFLKKMQEAGHFHEIMKTDKQIKEIIAKSGLFITKTSKFNSIFQTFFDYHMSHRILNRLFFVWKLPFKFYHLAIAPVVEIFVLWPDRLLQKMGIGSSAYYLGKK